MNTLTSVRGDYDFTRSSPEEQIVNQGLRRKSQRSGNDNPRENLAMQITSRAKYGDSLQAKVSFRIYCQWPPGRIHSLQASKDRATATIRATKSHCNTFQLGVLRTLE
ncbi:hypothetical protein BCCH1_29060 [Burkholderia contaminans]|uniref:Uncharacterized protein n=1 Tax=Burkholderia contaminans TaxID=488447 RepID=A0A250LAA5_9BURK|nr:hypothetical protein BCCH1_29060 [Burkholderia contaminans]GLZ70297.1 hypothetical protein Bcon01_33420 [Burkholderia contaminans]